MTQREYYRRYEKLTRPVKRTRYTVYDNETDFPIIVCGTAQECAARMGVSDSTFYVFMHKQRAGEQCRYHIVTEKGCDW